MDSTEQQTRRRRSCMVVPGSSARMLEKAATIAADELVIDLEDAVTPDAKDEAREMVVAALGRLADGKAALSVRVNAIGSPWCHRDVIAVAAAPGLRSIVVPKVEDTGDVEFVARLLDGVEAALGRQAPIRVQVLIESAAGLADVVAIARASSRVEALILGYADLAASLDRPAGRYDEWGSAQDRLVMAARAAGAAAIDGPYFDIADEAGMAAAAEHAARLGFDGKWAIHPSQVEPANRAFDPSSEAVERARRILAALAEADDGAVLFEGQMIDEAMAASARRVLARAGDLVR